MPFIVQWKGGALPEGTTYDRPVLSLDVLPAALTVVGVSPPPDLPGVDILPYLKGEKPNEDPGEQNNLMQEFPKKAIQLESLWRKWNEENAAPLWQPQSVLDMMGKYYGNEGMKTLKR